MIDDKKILLDATDKQAPFGIIPFRALNVQGRVLDFKKGGYWMPIEPHEKNIGFINSQIAAQLDGSFKGKVNQTSYGYIALGKRNTIDANTLENYKRNQEKSTAGIEITNHEVDDILLIENPLRSEERRVGKECKY